MRDNNATSPDEGKALVRLFYEAVDAKDMHAAGSLFAEGFQLHLAGSPDPLSAAEAADMEAALRAHSIQDQMAEDDMVATRLTLTGGPVEAEAMTIHRIEAGAIAEQWLFIHRNGTDQQLDDR